MRFGTLHGVMAFGLALSACGTAAVPAQDKPTEGGAPFKVTPVASFETPWAMTFLPGGREALVSEKDGRLWVVNSETGAKTAVSGLPKPKVAGQGGLGDVVVGPQNRI